MKCPNNATFRYTWPGQDESYVCTDHERQLQGLAHEIGLHLQTIPLEGGFYLTCRKTIKEKTNPVRG